MRTAVLCAAIVLFAGPGLAAEGSKGKVDHASKARIALYEIESYTMAYRLAGNPENAQKASAARVHFLGHCTKTKRDALDCDKLADAAERKGQLRAAGY